MVPSAVEAKRFATYVAEPPELDAAVAEIREIDRRGGMERTVAIGRLVLHRFFGGSVEAWRHRSKHKNNSVRRIAQHPLCPLSRSAINQAIGIFVAFQTLACDQTFGHIGPSHIAVVLHLDPRAQRRWIERAEREGWSVRELKDCVTRQRREAGEKRGRPRASAADHLVLTTQRLADSVQDALANLAPDDIRLHDRLCLTTLATRIEALGRDLNRILRCGYGSDKSTTPLPAAAEEQTSNEGASMSSETMNSNAHVHVVAQAG